MSTEAMRAALAELVALKDSLPGPMDWEIAWAAARTALAQRADEPALTAAQADRIIGALDPSDGGHDGIAKFILSLTSAPAAPAPQRTDEPVANECLRIADAIDPMTRKGLDNLTCAVAAKLLRSIAAPAAPAAPAAQRADEPMDDQEWDRRAERIHREMFGSGGGINPNATSVDDIFLDDEAATPAAPAYVPLSYASEEDLYWRLHALSKMLEQSDIIDGTVHRDAYPTILDAMKAIREAPSSAVFNNLFEQARRIAAERDTLAQPATPPEGQVWVRESDGAFVMRPETFIVPAAEREALRAELETAHISKKEWNRIDAERDALKRFSLAMLEHWPLGEVDGGELQEEAVKHGLLVPETRTAVCSEEGCNCAEYYSAEEWAEGITCYRKAAWLKGMAT